jgi:hypothetical protein
LKGACASAFVPKQRRKGEGVQGEGSPAWHTLWKGWGRSGAVHVAVERGTGRTRQLLAHADRGIGRRVWAMDGECGLDGEKGNGPGPGNSVGR